MELVFDLCPGWDSNPQAHEEPRILSPLRMPIPPPGQKRPGWELHPRIGVLQTPALLLGYQAKIY